MHENGVIKTRGRLGTMKVLSNEDGVTHQFKPLQRDSTEVHWTPLRHVDKTSLQHGHCAQHMDPPAKQTRAVIHSVLTQWQQNTAQHFS